MVTPIFFDLDGTLTDPRPGITRSIVHALEALGHDVGGADGLPGFKTRRSIGRWQEATGQAATCFPDAAIVQALRR